MIKKLSYQEIDFEKYKRCIERSVQKKFYAEPIFLDLSSNENWDILVYKDYEAVMPIPFVKKLGFKLVINPKLCQQLGVFSKEDSVKINDLFLDYFQKKYIIWYYGFNDVNQFSVELKKRNNFLILPNAYEKVRKAYSPKRKRKLRLDEEVAENSEIKKNPDVSLIKNFIFNTGLSADEKDLKDFVSLLIKFYHKDRLDFYGFFYHQQLINLIAIYKEDYSIALLGTYNDRDFVKLSGSCVLIDQVIAENIEHRIFDFEGSEVPAVEEFFRGFRPELKPYSCIEKSKKEVLQQVLKQMFSF